MQKETITTKTRPIKYEKVIKNLFSKWEYEYKWLKLLQGAIEFRAKIPKSYIYGPEFCIDGKNYADYYEIGLTKDDARRAREEIIVDIISTMVSGKTPKGHELRLRHYERLFHALAVLDLEKETNLLPGTTKNMIFNAMYMVWRLDDGSEKSRNLISKATLYMSRELHKRSKDNPLKTNFICKPEVKYKDVIKNLIHEWQHEYRWLNKLQGAVEFKGRIPKSYIMDADYYTWGSYTKYYEIGETKADAINARNQLIQDIVSTIMSGESLDGQELLPDNYARLFKALTVLKVDKETKLLAETTDNLMFNAMYLLWKLDDGSCEKKSAAFKSAGWYMAEELKKACGQHYCQPEHLILGAKC